MEVTNWNTGGRVSRSPILRVLAIAGLILPLVFISLSHLHHQGNENGHRQVLHHYQSHADPKLPMLGGFWPFGRNQTRSYHRDLKSITKKLMAAAFASTDKNRSGYLEFDEVVPMMHIFYFVSKLDLIDYMVEDLPDEQMNATATALAQEYFGNVTDATYEEEARAFIQKLDLDGDGRLSRKEIEYAFAELMAEFEKKPISAEEFISYLSYFTGSLYRIGMLDGDALTETNLLQIMDSTKDPKAAVAAVTAYIKALRRRGSRRS